MNVRKKHILSTLLVLVMALAVLPSCNLNPKKEAKVMVVFSYDKSHRMYDEFLAEVRSTLYDGGYNPNVRAVYMDMENSSRDFKTTLQQFRDSMKSEGWAPDIMLFEGDRPARQLITPEYDSIFDFNRIPIVLGALHHPNAWKNLEGHTNIAKWSDPMDFCTNIDLAVKLTGMNCVEIELDYGAQDDLLREELNQQISRPPYVNYMDFHDSRISDTYRETTFKDSIMVLVYNTQMPWLNVKDARPDSLSEDWETGNDQLNTIYTYAWKYPQLIVKKDVYSDLIATKTDRPQFTAVKSDFGNGKGDYLAGYFASYQTIAHDITETAIRILDGTPPNKIDMKEHQKQMWMDYEAMERLGMNYDDYVAEFNIINAPNSVAYRNQYITTIIAYVLGIIGFIVLIIYIVYKIRDNIIKRDKKRLEESVYITNLCLQGADSYQIFTSDDIEKYIQHADEGQEDTILKIKNSYEVPGAYRFKLKGDLNRNGIKEFWELRYTIRENLEINGLLLNVNEREHQKEQMAMALKASMESQKKESFMLKTSREISTPLDAIRKYSDLLTSGNVKEEEKQLLSEKITKSSEQLTTIINDILLFSRIESGRQQYFLTDVDVKKFMQSVYEEWIPKVQEKENIELKLLEGRNGVLATADMERVRDIMSQFLSNALKFTQEGVIYIGWRYHLGGKNVEIFVEDTGEGISESKQKVAFSLFWKANDFMPGVGLGLNIAKRLADNMDGQILITSQEGFGSRFTLILPGHCLL